MDVRLPDGTILRGVPGGTTREQIAEKLQKGGREVPEEWLAKPAAEPSLMEKGGHLAAVTNRAILKGLGDLPGVALDVVAYPFRKGTEALTGETIPTYGQLISSGLDQLTATTGVGADPQSPGERILASSARGAAGALSGTGMGQQLARSAGPTTAAIGEFLAQNPIVQSLSGAGAGASGQTAQEMGAGPGGQLAASLAGGLLTGLVASPFAMPSPSTGLPPGSRLGPPATPTANSEYQRAVASLEREGIPLTTGQKTGTNWIKSTERSLAEVPIGGRPIQNAFESQARDYQAALLRRVGLDSGEDMITRDVLGKAKDNLGQRYAGALRDKSLDLSDDAFMNNLAGIEAKHSEMLPFEQKQQVRQIINDFLDKASELKSNGRGLTGEEYQRLRSTLGTKATGTQNSYIAGLYGDLKGALDDLFTQTAGSNKFAIDQQYARLKQLQAIFERTGGPAASEGFISPAAVAREAAGAPGGTDWQDFTRAAATVLPDRLNNSGTAPRAMVLNALAGGGALAQPIPTAATLGASNLLARQLAKGATLPDREALAQALLRAGYPASLATLQQEK